MVSKKTQVKIGYATRILENHFKEMTDEQRHMFARLFMAEIMLKHNGDLEKIDLAAAFKYWFNDDLGVDKIKYSKEVEES